MTRNRNGSAIYISAPILFFSFFLFFWVVGVVVVVGGGWGVLQGTRTLSGTYNMSCVWIPHSILIVSLPTISVLFPFKKKSKETAKLVLIAAFENTVSCKRSREAAIQAEGCTTAYKQMGNTFSCPRHHIIVTNSLLL